MVKSTAKKLAVFANVMVVLSEANAALTFGNEPRHKFIWVDGMTVEEATAYAKKVFPEIDGSDLALFIDNVGSLPIQVRDFAVDLKSGKLADNCIKTLLLTAKKDLAGFIHQPILKALKNKPDGVGTEEFAGVEHKGVLLAWPKAVAKAMKEQTAIMFHPPSGEYRLASRAHLTALRDLYDPVEISS